MHILELAYVAKWNPLTGKGTAFYPVCSQEADYVIWLHFNRRQYREVDVTNGVPKLFATPTPKYRPLLKTGQTLVVQYTSDVPRISLASSYTPHFVEKGELLGWATFLDLECAHTVG
jgi:hypothetical protein